MNLPVERRQANSEAVETGTRESELTARNNTQRAQHTAEIEQIVEHVIAEQIGVAHAHVGLARVQEETYVVEREDLGLLRLLVNERRVDAAGQEEVGERTQRLAVAQRVGKLGQCELMGA